MTSKTYTHSDSFAGILDGRDWSFDAANPAMLRFRQGAIAIDCIGLLSPGQSIITLKIYLFSSPLKVFRQTINLSFTDSIERALYMAANRLCIHLSDLQSAMAGFQLALKRQKQQMAKNTFIF